MKPGNGGKENKILFFLVSWLPYCNIPSQLNQRYVAQFLVAASSFWLNHHKIDVRPNHGIASTFKYDSQGHAHIAAYTFSGSGDESLRYAIWVGSGGNCGVGANAGEWQCQTADAGTAVGREPDLVLDTNDNPIIGYVKPYGSVDQVFVAQTDSSGAGNCGSGASAGYWDCIYVNYAFDYYPQANPSIFLNQSVSDTG